MTVNADSLLGQRLRRWRSTEGADSNITPVRSIQPIIVQYLFYIYNYIMQIDFIYRYIQM